VSGRATCISKPAISGEDLQQALSIVADIRLVALATLAGRPRRRRS